jgi:hypothetical protein
MDAKEPKADRRKKDDKRKDKAGQPSQKCARLRAALLEKPPATTVKRNSKPK